jgi:hypothetical protein
VSMAALHLASIDDYLGPGPGRFFARGYQRATYRVADIRVGPADVPGTGAQATVDISYPADWSRKQAGGDLRPHLSTIDALVLGVQMAQVHVSHAYRLSADDRRSVRLLKVVLRAGGAPQEDLTGLPMSARLVTTEAVDGRDRFVSRYDCTVGNLRVRADIEHGVTGRATESGRYAGFDDALGRGERRFYGEGFKTRRHTITEVRVDGDDLYAEAEVRFTSGDGPAVDDGIDGDIQPSVTLIDAFVVNLQLAQVLLYELDGLSRAHSNTLWMMQTVLAAAPVPEPLRDPADKPLTSHARLVGKRLLPLHGGTWRSVEIEASLAGITLHCAFAHELPAEAAIRAVS